MEDKNTRDKLASASMQALIKVSALERALLDRKLLTEDELAEALASVVSDVIQTAKEQGISIKPSEEEGS